MAVRLLPLVLLAALLVPALARPGEASPQASTRPEATDHVRQGIAHFERAFYDLVPHKRQQEAEVEFDLAAASFQRELALRPHSINAWRALARLQAVRSRHAEAAAGYDEVTRLDPRDLDAYVMAALSYAETGQLDLARERLLAARAWSVDPVALAHLDGYLAKLAALAAAK